MELEFDPAKDETNHQKHGVSLAMAEALDWDQAIAGPDRRRDYGEERMIGYAPMAGRLFCVVFVDRLDARRIISLRKANSREMETYVKARAHIDAAHGG